MHAMQQLHANKMCILERTRKEKYQSGANFAQVVQKLNNHLPDVYFLTSSLRIALCVARITYSCNAGDWNQGLKDKKLTYSHGPNIKHCKKGISLGRYFLENLSCPSIITKVVRGRQDGRAPWQSGRACSQGTQRASWRWKGKEQIAPDYYNSAYILTLAFRFISSFWPTEHTLANV